jgi:hypothetical protein
MRKAVDRAIEWANRKNKMTSSVSYTNIYRQVYACFPEELPHEDRHRTALSITDGILDIYVKARESANADKVADAVVDVVLKIFQ